MFYLFKILIKLNLINLTIFIFKNFLVKGRYNPKFKNKNINILFLTIEKFRSDFEMLSRNKSINLLFISEVWLNIFYKIFYGKVKMEKAVQKAYLKNPPEFYKRKRNQYQSFLNKTFESLLKKYKLDFVVSADVRYYSNIDWGIAAEKKKIKWVIFHRENLFASKDMYEHVKKRHMQWEKFYGSKIIVHNNIAKKMFIESKFIPDPKTIKVIGCMRMDNLFNKTKDKKYNSRKNTITLFSFKSETVRWPRSVFNKTHQMVALFAKENPNIEVVIKPKIEITKKTDWYESFYKSTKEISIDVNSLPNLSILPNADPHELIMKSLFTIGLHSSVVLESAIVGIPVIIPYFKEIRTKKYKDTTYFRDYLDCFDTPLSSEELLKNMYLRLNQRKISKNIQKRRVKMFENYMGKFDGSICKKYISELNKIKTNN